MKLDNQDAWIFILLTIRYAMGRRSYMPNLAVELFNKYKSLLNDHQIDQIYREVSEEVKIAERMNSTLGDEINHHTWKKFIREREEIDEESMDT